MSDWQERLTRETPPAIWAEHELRYRLAGPLITSSSAWADLGCGNGVVAAAALGAVPASHAILSDLEAEVVTQAAAELGAPDATQISGDLTEPSVLATIADALLEHPGDRVVTCFEVVEHLATFLPLLEWSGELARDGAATFVVSIPNDAFWAIDNPFHAGRWGDGAFEELRHLLPVEQTLMRQVSLAGSGLSGWDGATEQHALSVELSGDIVATHFIAAFGPRHAELRTGALAVAVPQHEQRRWERQRESNLAYAEALAESRGESLSELRRLVAERDEWRDYIHELERALGRPLSGVKPTQEQP
jgi:hypothetical protein